MARSHGKLSATESAAPASYDLRLVPLPVDVARQMLIGTPGPESLRRWHPEYPLSDSIDAIAMVFAAHRVTGAAVDEVPTWWIHQIVVDGLVVGDIGFHGPPGPEQTVEIGYSVVPAWRRRRVASRACDLILQRAWQDGAKIVVAETDHDNVASQAVLLSNGFQQRPDGIFMIRRPEAS